MKTYVSGPASRRHAFSGIAIAVAAAMAMTCISAAAPALANNDRVLMASNVPMPRLNPQRGGRITSPDSISALIADAHARGTAAPLPRLAPVIQASAPVAASAAPSLPPLGSGSRAYNPAGLKLALQKLDQNDAAGATLAIYSVPNPIDIKIVEWLIATGSYNGVSAAAMADLQKKFAGWPGQALMRLRYEQAVARGKPSPQAAINALGGHKPTSDDATVLLARSYLALGRAEEAANLIRPFWRNQNFSEGVEKAVAADFGKLLRTSDHKWRMDRLIYAEREAEALRASKFLSAQQQALAQGVLAVVRQKRNAAAALEKVPAAVRKDHLYTYARVQLLRRANKLTDAARLILSASRDPAIIVDGNAWWVERRMISRQLMEAGNPKLAYQLAAGHSAQSAPMKAEAEFHAGWYALEFLRDPNTAVRHFANIEKVSSMPLSLSRAEYWMGRAYQAAGNRNLATHHFQRAARHQTTFYGQLSMTRLGNNRLNLSRPPAISKDRAARFADLELVQVIRHLSAVGHHERAAIFYRHLADTLNDAADMTLLVQMAERDGKHQLALQLGKTAVSRGLPVEALAFSTAAIPASAKTSNVEKALVYAIARQESAFNPAAVSRAGALGLLQLMPATAQETAKSLGLPYNKGRLTSDPAYNATLGAAYLSKLVGNFDGSYVMTFAGYNAGGSRVRDWVKRFGDPRDPRVDVVNWIESIPFTETRNYVQRIMENLQVYRAQLGQPQLVIEADLRRGAGS